MIRHNGIMICETTWTIFIGNKKCKFQMRMDNTGKRVRFKLVKYLLLAGPLGLSRKQLFSLLYDHDHNGGPLFGLNILDVSLSQMKHTTFKKLGIKLSSERRSGVQYLRLVPHVV